MTRAIRMPVVAFLAVLAVCALPEAAGALPPGWGYELVSPAVTAGADVDFGVASIDGDHAWASSTTPLLGDARTGNISALEETRTPTGWTQRQLADPSAPGDDSVILEARSEDSAHVLVASCPLTLIGCENYFRVERVDADGARTLMLEVNPYPPNIGLPRIVGYSSDMSRVYVNMSPGLPPLLPGDTHTQGSGLYESHDGQLEYVGYDQNGQILPCGAALATDELDAGPGRGFEQSGVSADGGTVAFESPDPAAGCPEPVDVYVRRNGHSVDISAPTNGNPDEGAQYLGSSRDGDTVYFMTRSQLVPADTDSAKDIYAYDVPSATLTRLTPGAEVIQAVVSPNGDYVYFDGFNPINGQGTEGAPNLYLYHGGTITHVITPASGIFLLGGAMSDSSESSPITPDGTHLLFRADADLTGQPVNETFQFFQYDATHGTLVCISCHRDGTATVIEPTLPNVTPTSSVDERDQSDDGRTVIFQTRDALVPQDVNGVSDVYMWRAGTVSLISGGFGPTETHAMGMDARGENVFFVTGDRLTPGVGQDNQKLYDARLGGGFPVAAQLPGCVGEECQGAGGSSGALGVPGSAQTSGVGNLTVPGSAPVAKRKATVKHKAKKRKAKKRKGKRGGHAPKGSVRISGGRGR